VAYSGGGAGKRAHEHSTALPLTKSGNINTQYSCSASQAYHPPIIIIIIISSSSIPECRSGRLAAHSSAGLVFPGHAAMCSTALN